MEFGSGPGSLSVNRIDHEFLRGNKGALRIPSLSFQYLRRPGCTAKLLCFQYSSSFDPHRPYQNFIIFQRVAENLAPFQRVSSKTRPARESTARRCASPMTCAYFCKVIRESLWR